jgi:hypothetical protein
MNYDAPHCVVFFILLPSIYQVLIFFEFCPETS